MERQTERLVCARAHCRQAHWTLTRGDGSGGRRICRRKGQGCVRLRADRKPLLEAAPSGLQIRTPYSRTVVTEIREIPLARWDADSRLWTVPYRSMEDLRRRWPAIEAAAERNEPHVRKALREALKGTEEERAAKARASERRRIRYPVPVDDMPPFERAIGTHAGVVIFTETQGELADPEIVTAVYFQPPSDEEYVWAAWRPGSLEELVTTWPARTPPGEREAARGWWVPNLDELRVARQKARSKRRADQRRQGD
ncbi:hypothetical protein AGROH133_14509 (plasmid) [Agrobacterium tumefaciens]|nr:hypothetical protein AGROH133_14509 [Agrobacterium tumefaciens]